MFGQHYYKLGIVKLAFCSMALVAIKLTTPAQLWCPGLDQNVRDYQHQMEGIVTETLQSESQRLR